eukprot:TRINITY_DN747_c0_g1_i9.p2 TRINITY_DN747_c0_g1~~TRINITY_DN747_c0_g1_i9.p2  ORF type:complete len:101 (-),score=28.53 TRINITY_DN747_c0_g1_i9:197-499(-)
MIRRPPRSTLSSSSAASDVYKRQILEICQDLVPDPLIDEDMQEIEKQIQDELTLEFKDGCFKVEFGNITSIKPPGKYYYHYRCECCEEGEAIDLLIGYDP